MNRKLRQDATEVTAMSNASSSAKHTPGPWKLSGIHFGGEGGKYGFREISSHIDIFWVARVQAFTHGELARYEANACLIAAAPELLEALKKTTSAAGAWLRAVDRHVPENLFEKIMADIGTQYDGFGVEARAAIAKAEGVLPETAPGVERYEQR